MRSVFTTTHKFFHQLHLVELTITIAINDNVNPCPHHFPLTHGYKQPILEPQQTMSTAYLKIERLHLGGLVTIDGNIIN